MRQLPSSSKGLAQRWATHPTALIADWAEAWEAISESKAEAFALNLDRSLLLLETWFRLQHLAKKYPV